MLKILLIILPVFLFGNESITLTLPDITQPEKLVGTLEMLLLFTIIGMAPSMIFMMTSFTRIVVVFSILKQALGLQSTPPATVLSSLALILTFFIMKPVAMESYNNGIEPYMNKQVDYKVAMEEGLKPFKVFMLKNTREKDLKLFIEIRGVEYPKTPDVKEIDFFTLAPAFLISELYNAFVIGILIFIPFLIIDIVVSSVLMSLGFMMLPPTMIALPIKILFFILIDGWYLLTKSLTESFLL
jgi:flagellar biosynthetic protein FliP